MIEIISTTMHEDLIKEVTKNNHKISIIIDESTSVSKYSCLIVYIRSIIISSPVNIFLSIVELEGQDADSICRSLQDLLQRNKIYHEYLVRNLVAFTSDETSVMMGKVKGVAVKLKSKYPHIFLWHCLNHRLAVSDTMKAINGVYPVEAFFSKIYAIDSQSPKMQRELKDVANELDVQLQKVGKILTTRWVASSFRAVNSFSNNYPALYKHFQMKSQSPTDKYRSTYAGLMKKMETSEYVEDVAIIKECLGQLSILSESLQLCTTTLHKASEYLQWTVNALIKINGSLETKYNFKSICDSDGVDFKGIGLKIFLSRKGFASFNRKEFLALIDNLQRRMIYESEKLCSMK